MNKISIIKYIILNLLFIGIGSCLSAQTKINIAAVLPLNSHLTSPTKNQKIQSEAAISFLQGCMVGYDSITKSNPDIKIKFYVYEADNSQFNYYKNLVDTFKKYEITSVILPLSTQQAKNLSRELNRTNIKAISPISLIDTCIDSTFLYQSNPTLKNYAEFVAQFIKDSFMDRRILLINENRTETDYLSRCFVKNFISDSLKIVNCNFKGSMKANVLDYISPTKNIVFIPSRSEVFTTAMLSQIQSDSSEETIIIGLYPWLSSKNIGFDIWKKFKIHIVTPYYIDYERMEVNHFIGMVRKKFKDEPNEMTFRGFDDFMFTINNELGSNTSATYLHNNYNMIQNNQNCPTHYINSSLMMLKFENNELQLIK